MVENGDKPHIMTWEEKQVDCVSGELFCQIKKRNKNESLLAVYAPGFYFIPPFYAYYQFVMKIVSLVDVLGNPP